MRPALRRGGYRWRGSRVRHAAAVLALGERLYAPVFRAGSSHGPPFPREAASGTRILETKQVSRTFRGNNKEYVS